MPEVLDEMGSRVPIPMIFCPICEPSRADGPFTPVLCAECSERNAAQPIYSVEHSDSPSFDNPTDARTSYSAEPDSLVIDHIEADLDAYMRGEASIVGEVIANMQKTGSALRADYFGYSATCTVCGRGKQPVGRSAPMGMMMCNPFHLLVEPYGCIGYNQEPLPSHLWPGESEADFGYRVPR